MAFHPHLNSHHIYPKSRIPRKYRAGKNKLLGRWMVFRDISAKKHNSFHAIFGNRTPDEQAELLKRICNGNGILILSVYRRYQKSFNDVFGSVLNLEAMIEILKKWDLSPAGKQRYAEKLIALNQILNRNIMGGVSLKKMHLE